MDRGQKSKDKSKDSKTNKSSKQGGFTRQSFNQVYGFGEQGTSSTTNPGDSSGGLVSFPSFEKNPPTSSKSPYQEGQPYSSSESSEDEPPRNLNVSERFTEGGKTYCTVGQQKIELPRYSNKAGVIMELARPWPGKPLTPEKNLKLLERDGLARRNGAGKIVLIEGVWLIGPATNDYNCYAFALIERSPYAWLNGGGGLIRRFLEEHCRPIPDKEAQFGNLVAYWQRGKETEDPPHLGKVTGWKDGQLLVDSKYGEMSLLRHYKDKIKKAVKCDMAVVYTPLDPENRYMNPI